MQQIENELCRTDFTSTRMSMHCQLGAWCPPSGWMTSTGGVKEMKKCTETVRCIFLLFSPPFSHAGRHADIRKTVPCIV